MEQERRVGKVYQPTNVTCHICHNRTFPSDGADLHQPNILLCQHNQEYTQEPLFLLSFMFFLQFYSKNNYNLQKNKQIWGLIELPWKSYHSRRSQFFNPQNSKGPEGFVSEEFWGHVDTLSSVPLFFGCSVVVVLQRGLSSPVLRACPIRSNVWSAGVFGQMVYARGHPEDCQNQGFRYRTLHCSGVKQLPLRS